MKKMSKGSGYERSRSADNVDVSQSRPHDDFYRSGCFRFAEEVIVDGWHAHQGIGKWWSHRDAGGWGEYDPASTSMRGTSLENSPFWNSIDSMQETELMSGYERKKYTEYRQLAKSGRVKEATDEQRAASAKMSRLHLDDDPQRRIKQNNRVRDNESGGGNSESIS